RMRVIAGEHRVCFAHRQALPQIRLLQHDADALAKLAARSLWVVAEHAHLARVARSIPLEDLDGGRLARAVWTKESEDLAFGDLEVDAAHRLDVAVRLPQSLDGDRAHS